MALIRFVIEQLAVSPGAAVFTVPEGSIYQVIAAVANNKDTSNNTTITVEINTASGGLKEYVTARTVPKGKSDLLPEIVGQAFLEDDVLQAFASAAADINLRVTVNETIV